MTPGNNSKMTIGSAIIPAVPPPIALTQSVPVLYHARYSMNKLAKIPTKARNPPIKLKVFLIYSHPIKFVHSIMQYIESFVCLKFFEVLV